MILCQNRLRHVIWLRVGEARLKRTNSTPTEFPNQFVMSLSLEEGYVPAYFSHWRCYFSFTGVSQRNRLTEGGASSCQRQGRCVPSPRNLPGANQRKCQEGGGDQRHHQGTQGQRARAREVHGKMSSRTSIFIFTFLLRRWLNINPG